MAAYVGPTVMNCPQRCEVPAGWRVSEVPQPRHAWPDVHGCPNDGCGRWLLASEERSPEAADA